MPARKLGARWMVPAWWLKEVLEDATGAPVEAPTEAAAE